MATLAYLEGDLRCEDELVPLEQSPGGIHEHGVGDAVDEVQHTLFDLLRGFSSLDGLVEHHTECLKGVIYAIINVACP